MVRQVDQHNPLNTVTQNQKVKGPAVVPAASADLAVTPATGISSVTGPQTTTLAPQAVALTTLPFDTSAANSVNLTPDQLAAGNIVAQGLSSGMTTESLQSHWADFIATTNTSAAGGPVDVNALVQWVLRQSYIEQTADLQFYAQKVQFFNSLKQAIREELTRARTYDSSLVSAGGGNSTPANYDSVTFANDPVFDDNGTPQIYSASGGSLGNRGELETYIQNLEDQLNSVGDDAQLANVDLQDMLQKQQATLQLISNISKMLYDTALAVIRKIGS